MIEDHLTWITAYVHQKLAVIGYVLSKRLTEEQENVWPDDIKAIDQNSQPRTVNILWYYGLCILHILNVQEHI